MTNNDARLDAMLILAALTERNSYQANGKPLLFPWEISFRIAKLARLAKSLHQRYAAACNFEWANTDAYEKRTNRIEKEVEEIVASLGFKLELQQDPRGWPVIICERYTDRELVRLG